MKLPYFISRQLPALFPKRKLRAATRQATADTADFDDEPNVRLSSAFVVVLVLHVVAVGGIYAFNSIKAHRPTIVDAPPGTQQTAAKSESAERSGKSAVMPAVNTSSAKIYRVKSGDTVSKIAAANGITVEELEEANGLKNVGAVHVGQDLRLPAKQGMKPISSESTKASDLKKPADSASKNSASASSVPKDSGQTYVIAKGDSVVSIAKKLHVPYDDLLKLNKIDDPKKLQIGQKLKVPVKAK